MDKFFFILVIILVFVSGSSLAFNGFLVVFIMEVIANYVKYYMGSTSMSLNEINRDFLRYILLLFGIALVATIGIFIQRYAIGRVGQKLAYKIRTNLFYELLRKNLHFFGQT